MTKISNQYSLTNILTADLANSRLGINNVSPTVALDVTGTARVSTSAYFATASGNVGIGTTTITYYVNGAASNTLVSGWNVFGGYKTNQTNFPASFTAFLGSSAYPSRGFKGKLAVALMYNRQLTAAEQSYNYNALKSRFGL